MDFIEDITPHQLRHAAIPNETIDYWERRDLLALGELVSFVRHSSGYGMTLTKLVNRCAGQGKTVLSKAYNALIEHRFLVRVEFTYARPAGSTDRSGQRYTKHSVSRVPISEERFAELVKAHAPGKYVLIPYGEPDESGAREMRRVKVLAAEVYCHLGAGRIVSETQLVPHEKRRGGKPKTSAKRAQPRPRKTAPDPAVEAEKTSTDPAPEPKGTTSSTLVAPEVEKPNSGATSQNTAKPQVAPEGDLPEFGASTSIKKTGVRTTDLEHEEARALASLGCAPGEPASGSTRTEAEGAAEDVVPTDSPHGSNHLNARAENRADDGSNERSDRQAPDIEGETLPREHARLLIQQTLDRLGSNGRQVTHAVIRAADGGAEPLGSMPKGDWAQTAPGRP